MLQPHTTTPLKKENAGKNILLRTCYKLMTPTIIQFEETSWMCRRHGQVVLSSNLTMTAFVVPCELTCPPFFWLEIKRNYRQFRSSGRDRASFWGLKTIFGDKSLESGYFSIFDQKQRWRSFPESNF